MPRRPEYFSLDEANALIPTLEYYFRQLLITHRDLAEAQHALLSGGATVAREGVQLPRPAIAPLRRWRDRYQHLCTQYDHIMEEILHLGVEVVDPEGGIVNFYTWHDREEVVLSWQYGEPAVHYWLDPGDRFFRRRPLQQLFGNAPGPRAQRH